MRHRKWALLLPLFPALLSTGSAPNAVSNENTAAHSHAIVHRAALRQSMGSAVVNGAEHPELIPDLVAYRLYFITVANMPPARQQAQLKQAGLNADDISRATVALTSFKVQWNQLRDTYNATVTKLGPGADSQAFIARRDGLVQATVLALNSSLTPAGSASVGTHVQNEKRRTRVSIPSTTP